jgi:hypothetical protein
MDVRKDRFRLVAPAGWEVREGDAGTLVTVIEPPPAEPRFCANVTVLRFGNEQHLTAKAVVDESLESMARLLTDFVLLERVPAKNGERLLYTFRQGIYGLTGEQRYVVEVDAYYVVTGTTANGDFAEQRELIAAAVDSFEPGLNGPDR